MTRFDDFVKDAFAHIPASSLQKLDGNYGCQICEKYTEIAYFDESTGEMFWYCQDKHKSSVQVG